MKLVDSVTRTRSPRLQAQQALSTWQDPLCRQNRAGLKALEAQLRDLIDKRNARVQILDDFTSDTLSSASQAVDEPYSGSCVNSSRWYAA
ncbi:hypothetical protein KCP77_19355 [Salmonella enterica subsp. enterica]|nr:hypothetical protein KCP77_19355 [Salmonella enterica subsp. enterica]